MKPSKLLILIALLAVGAWLAWKKPKAVEVSLSQSEAGLIPAQLENEQLQVKEMGEQSQAKAPEYRPNEQLTVMAQTEFRNYAGQVLARLPRVQDLQKLSAAEVHTTPVALQKAAVDLGRLAEIWSQHPGLRAPALEFYQKCARERDLARSVRALCLNRALRLYAELHQAIWEFDPSEIPDAVVDLAKRI